MDLNEKLQKLSGEVEWRLPAAKRSEANTSQFLVMPFFDALGYNVHNPKHVEPEFTADVGIQREKVDFALKQDGNPVILVEVKYAGASLDNQHAAQLRRYFSTKLEVRFGILTNGLDFRFFSDLENQNVMDDEPFLTLDLQNLDESLLHVLEQFSRTSFEKNNAIQAARSAKDRQRVRQVISAEFDPLSKGIIDYLVGILQPGRMSQTRRNELTHLVKQEWREFIPLQGSRTDSETHEEPPEPEPVKAAPTPSLFPLDGSVKIPIFATFKGHEFEAKLSLWGWIHPAAAIVFYENEWLTPLQAGIRTRVSVDSSAGYYVNGMKYWHLRDTANGKLRPINDLKNDEALLRRLLGGSSAASPAK